jgi:hypothetical protein
MDGGIVFSGGGGVQGFKGGGDMSARIAEGFTEREDEPSTLGSSGVSPNDLMALIRKRMESIDEAEKTAMLSPEEKELMRFKNTQAMQKEYDEYARGRGDRQASETRRAQEAAATRAFEEQKYREAPGRARAQAEFEAKLRREGRVPGVDERLYDDLTSKDPVRVNRAKTYLSGRYNTEARGQLTEAQVAKAVADFNDEFKGEQLRKQHGTVEKYLEYLRTTRANIGQGTSESSGEVVYDTSGKRVQ